MVLDKNFLQDCESLIANGKLDDALTKLLSIKDETGYKSDIIGLSGRWKQFAHDQLSGTYSNQELSLQRSKFSKQILLLIEALGRELNGEAVVPNLLSTEPTESTRNHWLRVVIPAVLASLATWAICYFAYQPTPVTCPTDVNINGDWKVYKLVSQRDTLLGNMKIRQDPCHSDFLLSGALSSTTSPGAEIDFSSKIGGINDGEIIFVYENLEGEIGVCRGVVPLADRSSFTVLCTDLAGWDENGEPELSLRFQRKPPGN